MKEKRLCKVCQTKFEVRKKQQENREVCSKLCARKIQWKGTFNPKTILECSSRTVTKILKRIGKMKCTMCSWDKGTCDIHHIKGKKIENPNHHSNLTLVCPNCHRLIHEKKIELDQLVTLEQFLGDTWKEGYYG